MVWDIGKLFSFSRFKYNMWFFLEEFGLFRVVKVNILVFFFY